MVKRTYDLETPWVPGYLSFIVLNFFLKTSEDGIVGKEGIKGCEEETIRSTRNWQIQNLDGSFMCLLTLPQIII